jgi:GNAT superfamily N-acetyltransferase
MSQIRIMPVTVRNAGDLATMCAGDANKSDELWQRAIKAKRAWVRARLADLGTFAWLAYDGADAVGVVQCHPERDGGEVAFIDCLWVPGKRYWGHGVGKKLLATVESSVSKQHRWFDGKSADAVAALAFHGEAEGQRSAESFYAYHGFVRMQEDAEIMVKILETEEQKPALSWTPHTGDVQLLTPQPEDMERVTVLLGPIACPFQYRILSKTGTYAGEKLGMPVAEVDAMGDPDGYAVRGGHSGILVGDRPLRYDLLEREKLDEELNALGVSSPHT